MDPNWHAQLMVDEINKQSERDTLLKETHDALLQMQEASEKESKINRRRFQITLIVSLVAATAAVIAALPHTLL